MPGLTVWSVNVVPFDVPITANVPPLAPGAREISYDTHPAATGPIQASETLVEPMVGEVRLLTAIGWTTHTPLTVMVLDGSETTPPEVRERTW